MSANEREASPITGLAVQPHAYAVETLWDQGSWAERWGFASEMDPQELPQDRAEAEQIVAELIADGHDPDAVRIVAIVLEYPGGQP